MVEKNFVVKKGLTVGSTKQMLFDADLGKLTIGSDLTSRIDETTRDEALLHIITDNDDSDSDGVTSYDMIIERRMGDADSPNLGPHLVLFSSNTASSGDASGSSMLDDTNIGNILWRSETDNNTDANFGQIRVNIQDSANTSRDSKMFFKVQSNNSMTEMLTINGEDGQVQVSNGGLKIGSGAAVTTILDEDNMASDSATALATQQSIKAYVASQVGAAGGGDITGVDLTGGTGVTIGSETGTTSGNYSSTISIGQAVGTSDDVTFSTVTIASDLIHSGDTNNKITFGTDTQTFTTAGSARMFVDTDGKIGVGTTSPTDLLSVDGGIKIGVYNESDGTGYSGTSPPTDHNTGTGASDPVLRVSGRSTGRSAIMQLAHFDSNNFFGAGDDSTVDYTLGQIQFAMNENSNTVTNVAEIRSTSRQIDVGGSGDGKFKGDLQFLTSDGSTSAASLTTKMTITEGGNVGIGTTSPDGVVHIKHTDNTGVPALKLETDASASPSDCILRIQESHGSDTFIDFTVNTFGQLEITGGASTRRQIFTADDPDTDDSGIISLNKDHYEWDTQIFGDSSTPVIFVDGTNSRMGVGTTTPLNKLVLAHTGADGDDGMTIVRADSTTASGDLLGGIGFDSTDGNEPSSVLEASAGIAAYAAEDHSTGDKGGDLVFFTASIDEDDDTASTERVRITSKGSIELSNGTAATPDADHVRITEDGGTLRVDTPSGYVDIGPANSGFSHFSTDRNRFYMNKPLVLDGGDATGDNYLISAYSTEDFVIATNSGSEVRMTIKQDTGRVGIGGGNATSPDQMFHVEGGSILIDAYNAATTTLASNYSDGATSLVLTSSAEFATAGSGTIDGTEFTWTANDTSSNTLTVPDLDASYTAGVTVVADTGLFLRDGFENVAQPSVTVYDRANSGASRDDLSINANSGIRFRLSNESQMQLTADQLSLTTGNQGAAAIFGFRDRADMGIKSNTSYSVGVMAPDNVFIQTDSNNNGSSNYIDFGHGSSTVGSAESMMRIVMDAATGPGKVGIGTTSPDAPLHIKSTGTGDTVIIESSDAPAQDGDMAPNLVLLRSGIPDATTNTDAGKIQFKALDSDGGTNILLGHIQSEFNTATGSNGSARMRVNVSSSGGSGHNDYEYLRFDGGVRDVVFNEDGRDIDVRIEGDSDTALFFTDASSDRIGIGTTSPDAKLHVSTGDDLDCGIIIEADTDNNDEADLPFLWMKQDGDITAHAFQGTSNKLQIINNISSSGGIDFLTGTTNNTGTTNPATSATVRLGIASGGAITFNGEYTFPTSDGSNGQVLQTNGSGTLSFASVSGGGGMSDLVDDTSPQLGGDLDTNGHDIIIDDGKGVYADAISNGRELLIFQHTSSANSYIEVYNGVSDSATGTLFGTDVVGSDTTGSGRLVGPGFAATGDTTDVGMSFRTKGLGNFVFVNEDTTSSASPALVLMRKHSSEADNNDIGIIKFMAMDDSPSGSDVEDLRDYAKIRCETTDVTSGNADGYLMISALRKDSHTDFLSIGSDPNAHGDTPAAGVAAKAGQMRTFSSNLTVTRADHAGLYLVATSAMTFNLPASPHRGEQYIIMSNTASTVTISANGSDTMNGSTNNQTITTRYEAKTCIAVGDSEWIVLG